MSWLQGDQLILCRERSFFNKKPAVAQLLIILPVVRALYGAETWTLRAVDQKHLESFEM